MHIRGTTTGTAGGSPQRLPPLRLAARTTAGTTPPASKLAFRASGLPFIVRYAATPTCAALTTIFTYTDPDTIQGREAITVGLYSLLIVSLAAGVDPLGAAPAVRAPSPSGASPWRLAGFPSPSCCTRRAESMTCAMASSRLRRSTFAAVASISTSFEMRVNCELVAASRR